MMVSRAAGMAMKAPGSSRESPMVIDPVRKDDIYDYEPLPLDQRAKE